MSTLRDMVQQFLGSSHGNEAVETLQREHGLSAQDAQHAVAAAAQAAHEGDGGGALPAFGGGGMLGGALNGALGGAAAGAAGQILAQRTGMNPQMAQSMVAAAMPFVLRYLQNRGGHSAQSAPRAPQPAPQNWDAAPDMPPNTPWSPPPGGPQNWDAPQNAPQSPPRDSGSSWLHPERADQGAKPTQQQPDKPKPPWKRFL